MLDLLRHRGQSTIADLAAEFQVSEDTVRRDLEELASQGAIRRTHGGATLDETDQVHLPFARRLEEHAVGKDRIARAAAALIQESQTVFVNGGTTTLAMARHLADVRGLVVVTNNLRLPERLYSRGAREVYLIGGMFRLRSLVTIGPVALSDGLGNFCPVHADVAFIGVGGVADDGVISTTSLPEAGMMRAMMDSAGHAVILADASKFGRTQFAQVCSLNERTTLVTDEVPGDALRTRIADAGARLIVAGPPGAS